MEVVLVAAAPVSGSVPLAFANPAAMLVGLIILVGVFAWLWMRS